jgi:hypothetical protein
MEKYKPEQQLADAIGFTEADLNSNRDGALSMAQRWKLHDEGGKALRLALAALVGGLLFAVLLMVFSRSPGMATMNTFIVLGAAGLFLYGGWRWLGYSADTKTVPAELEGRVKLDANDGGRSGVTFTIQVEGVTFPVKKNVFLAFKNGDPYRIYYAPRSKKLLSAEWLRE